MTTNEMIYKTITTKLTKEPKYKSVLEDMGYKVYDSDMSVCGCWTVENPENGRCILFSKGYDSRRRLYGGYKPVETKDFKKVNFVGYLRKCKYDSVRRSSEYSKLRWKIKEDKWYANYYLKEVEETQKKVNEITKKLEYYKERYNDTIKELEKHRERVNELKAQ